jgi:hypothetical protein
LGQLDRHAWRPCCPRGDTLATAFGRYIIQPETEYATDLSGFGPDDLEAYVECYRLGTAGIFLPTLTGSVGIAGKAGLGSELDSARTGSAWAGFGEGRCCQVNSANLPTNSGATRMAWPDFDGEGWSEPVLRHLRDKASDRVHG